MSKQHEALRLALDALDCIYSPLHVREINKVGAAITALREALAEQPAQQEPVECANGCRGFVKHSPPAQRKPLTDEEIETLLVNWPEDGIAFFEFARAIEAKLKEKNNG